MDLHNHKKDLHWYTNTLEQTVIDALASLGIQSSRNKVNTGVWIGENKICAIGVTASRWVTMHGLALNVSPDLRNYDLIIPCGIANEGYGVCSISNFKPHLDMETVVAAFLQSFSANFGVEFQSRSLSDLQETMDSYPALSSAVIDRAL